MDKITHISERSWLLHDPDAIDVGARTCLPMKDANRLVNRDTPVLHRLAGLDESDAWLIDKVWADVIAELNVESVSVEAAWQLAITHEIAPWRPRRSPLLM